jgi:polysaccharide biosynthesis/export protein
MRSTLFILAVCLALVAGCAKDSPADSPSGKLNSWLAASSGDLPPVPYTVEPPDAITVNAPLVPEINGRTLVVRADGKVAFNLIGTIEVAGLTTDQIAQELALRCKRYYDKQALDITVNVSAFRSKFIYVFGQVNSPGMKPYTGSDSLLKILADSGFNDRSWPEKVVVVRPAENADDRQRVTVNVAQMYETGNTDHNVLLQEGDVVFVPPNPMAKFNMTFEQILVPLKPTVSAALLVSGL